jgi:hypothetical protein
VIREAARKSLNIEVPLKGSGRGGASIGMPQAGVNNA